MAHQSPAYLDKFNLEAPQGPVLLCRQLCSDIAGCLPHFFLGPLFGIIGFEGRLAWFPPFFDIVSAPSVHPTASALECTTNKRVSQIVLAHPFESLVVYLA